MARMEARMDAGFARADRFFELQHAQHLELRGEFAELRAEVRELRDRVDALTDRAGRLEHEVSLLRDYVTREVAEIRLDLRVLRERPGQTVELRREIAELTVRVDRLEQRQSD
jgi:predicted RNase H-like nuclease (RuvC/YqgF family)